MLGKSSELKFYINLSPVTNNLKKMLEDTVFLPSEKYIFPQII